MKKDSRVQGLVQLVTTRQLYSEGKETALEEWKAFREEVRHKHMSRNLAITSEARPKECISFSSQKSPRSPIIQAMADFDVFYRKISPKSARLKLPNKIDSLSFKSFDNTNLCRSYKSHISSISLPTCDSISLPNELPISQLERLITMLESQSLSDLPADYQSKLETFAQLVNEKTKSSIIS